MFKLNDLLNRFKTGKMLDPNSSEITDTIRIVKSWYEEKYDTLLAQRNLLVIMLFAFILLTIAAAVAIGVVINARKFDPFVIQIDETTGQAKIVDPMSSEILQGNDELAKYFIKKYVIARETYNPVDFDTEARRTVRLLSSGNVYRDYNSYIKGKKTDPSIVYGLKNTTYLTAKSWSKLDKKKFLLRFAITETSVDKKVMNKIAVVDFDYAAMDLTEAERDINPIGFQVKGYRVDDDNS